MSADGAVGGADPQSVMAAAAADGVDPRWLLLLLMVTGWLLLLSRRC